MYVFMIKYSYCVYVQMIDCMFMGVFQLVLYVVILVEKQVQQVLEVVNVWYEELNIVVYLFKECEDRDYW